MFQTMRPGVDYNLTLSRTENRLTVLVMPKINELKDTAQHNLVPFTLTGTAEEIDRGFFPALHQPVARAAGLLTKMAEYEKQADKAAAASKSAKEEKNKTDKAAKEKKEKQEADAPKADMGTLFETPSVQAAPVPPAQQVPVQQPPLAPPIQTQPAAPAQPMPGFGMFGPPVPQPSPQPAIQQPPQTYPSYPPMPQYPQTGPGSAGTYPDYPSGAPLYNPADYAEIPDVHLTHVGQGMNHIPSML